MQQQVSRAQQKEEKRVSSVILMVVVVKSFSSRCGEKGNRGVAPSLQGHGPCARSLRSGP